MLVNSITFVLLLAIALCCLESGAASTTCVCSEQMGGICFYQPATATSVPTDLWSCNQINGTLKIDISGNIDFTTQSFFANYIYGDIEFYADSSISTTPVTISFPFLDALQGTVSFDFPQDKVANLTVSMNSISCWTTTNAPSGNLMSLDFPEYQNIAMKMDVFGTFNATGGIEIMNKGMIDLSNAAIARLSSLTLTNVDIGDNSRFNNAFKNLQEITDTLTISGSMSNGGNGSQSMAWFPDLESVGGITLLNNTVPISFPQLKKLDSLAQSGANVYGLDFAANTGKITIGINSGTTTDTQQCKCTTSTTGTCTNSANWVNGWINSFCYGAGYTPSKKPVCHITPQSQNSSDTIYGTLPGWIIAIIVVSVLLVCCLPILIFFGCCAAGTAMVASASNRKQPPRVMVGVPTTVAEPGQLPVVSPMAPGVAQPVGVAQAQPYSQEGDFHARRVAQQNAGSTVAPPPLPTAYSPQGMAPPMAPPPGMEGAAKTPSAPGMVSATPVDVVPPPGGSRISQELPSYEQATGNDNRYQTKP